MAVCAAAEQAEKACQHAEELFLAGKIDGAHAQAKEAKRLCPSLPFIDNAIAVYEVHLRAAAAAAKRGAVVGWRAVLGIGPGPGGSGPATDAATQDAVRKEFRRLSLLVHPDKAHSAAAVSAFRLIRDAHNEALPPPPPPPPPSPAPCSSPDRYPAAHDPDDDTSAPPPQKQPPQQQPARGAKKVTVLMMTQPRQPAQEPREPTLIYCPSCEVEFRGMVGRRERREGMRCARCPACLSTPWQTKPRAEKKPAPAPGRRVFRCPATCPRCGERYASVVCVGRWCLQCKACSMAAMVDVLGPDQATASVKRRACVS